MKIEIIFGIIGILLIAAMLLGSVEEQSVTSSHTSVIIPIPTIIPTPSPTPALITQEEIQYAKANSELITLINHRDSTNPTLLELRQFIENDNTDERMYRVFSYVCADYAEQVHNNAEAQGIKAGVVIVSFKDDVDLHALNVFDTKDQGIVYVDCTGEERFYRASDTEYFCDSIKCSNDRFAYIKENYEYGIISMSLIDINTNYEYYTTFKYNSNVFLSDIDSYSEEVASYNTEMTSYNTEMTSYNTEVLSYSRDVDHYDSLPSTYYDDKSYSEAMELYNELEKQERELDSWSNELEKQERELDSWNNKLDNKLESIKNRENKCCCVWESLGIVEDIEVYW